MHHSRRVPRILDARGQAVTQLDPYELWLTRRTEGIPADVLSTLAREIGLGLARSQRVLFYVALVCLGIVLLSLVESGTRMLLSGRVELRELGRAATRLLPVVVGPPIFWLGARQVRFRRTTQVMLRHRRCPHCGYDLRGLPTLPEDGTTRCPECGCVWRLDTTAE
jgi:hypothetical protein